MDAVMLNGRILQATEGGLLVRFTRPTLDPKSSATSDLWIPFTALRVVDAAGKLVVDESWLRERLGASLPSYLPPATPDVARIAPPTPILERSPVWTEIVRRYHPDTAAEATFTAAQVMSDLNRLVEALTR